ncbi:hypothetical protein ACQP1P_27270 [Dactylosporangium sp. CA-052675]|uniref:hypothetical protein n=1 Tax=Dactylosporangium sp. CA-052675 TaxID=3239927 RepID=UPI003D8E7B4C
MIERVTHRWRRETAEQEAAVAAGTMPREEAYALTFFPPAFVAAVDAALEAYEREVASLRPPTDEAVWAAVERVVVALTRVRPRTAGPTRGGGSPGTPGPRAGRPAW